MTVISRPKVVPLFLAAALLGCNSSFLFEVDRDPLAGTAHVRLSDGGEISQAVTLTPERPRQGETFHIRSVVRNTGSRPVTLTSAICLLPVDGGLVLSEPLILCAAVSMTGDLAAGDSIEIVRETSTSSPPGSYRIAVRHLLDPAVSVPVEVTVLP